MKKPHFAIYHTWPDIKNAEYEQITRIIDAATNVGVDVSIIDNNGYILSSTNAFYSRRSPRISHRDCDFAISLHFESPKTVDLYSYSALWNPAHFYFSWGYDGTSNRLISHDDALSCDSEQSDAHAVNLLYSVGRLPPLPLPRFHHTTTRDVLKANIGKSSRCFYVGINWERVTNEKGRHHDLLVALDKLDIIDIYGPEEFQGVVPWEGFKCYRGSIPFDGKSTIKRIAEAGICLALSSAAHQNSGIMSNRLFEGLAAGSYIIANRHPFIDKFFKDVVVQIDDRLSGEQVVARVVEEVRWVQANPEEAQRKASQAQRLFLERFALEDEISRLTQNHVARREASAIKRVSIGVTAIVSFGSTDLSRLDEILSSIEAQTLEVEAVFIVVDANWRAFNHQNIADIVAKYEMTIEFFEGDIFDFDSVSNSYSGRKHCIGPTIWQALQRVSSDCFMITNQSEILFSNHLAELARALTSSAGHSAAASGILIEDPVPDGRRARRMAYLAPPNLDMYLHGNLDRYCGQHLYKLKIRDSMNEYTFSLLDGQEHNLFNAVAFETGTIANSFAVTLVHSTVYEDQSLSPVIPVESQHQFVRDAMRQSSLRLSFLRANSFPSIVFAPPGGTPIGWLPPRRPGEIGSLIQMDRRYAIGRDGDGARLVGTGFSHLEDDGVWIDGNIGLLEFAIPTQTVLPAADQEIVVAMELLGRSVESSCQDVFIFVNGVFANHLSVEGAHRRWYSVSTRVKGSDHGAAVKIRFVTSSADQVKDDDGNVLDPRRLSLNISAIEISVKPPGDLAEAESGAIETVD